MAVVRYFLENLIFTQEIFKPDEFQQALLATKSVMQALPHLILMHLDKTNSSFSPFASADLVKDLEVIFAAITHLHDVKPQVCIIYNIIFFADLIHLDIIFCIE